MTKNLIRCSLVVIALLLSFSVSTVLAKELVATEADNGKVLVLSKGDTLFVKLSVLMGNGYSWEIATYSKQTLKYLGMRVETDKSEPGAVSTQIFTFEPTIRKSGLITVIYRRPFEKNRPPVKVFRIRVRVS